MIRHHCRFPGCLGIADRQGGYCQAHASLQVERDRREADTAAKRWDDHHGRIDYASLWHTARWRRLRAEHLRRHPNCIRCDSAGKTVDHVRPARGDETLFFNPDNLQTLCSRHHAAKSREDRDA